MSVTPYDVALPGVDDTLATADNPLPLLPVVEDLTPEEQARRLRRALTDALTHLEAGTIPAGPRVRAWRELAGMAYVEPGTPHEEGMAGSARAAAKWTPEERAAVDDAIRAVARAHAVRAEALRVELGASGRAQDGRGLFPDEFTTADVWAHLGEGFPVTKGIASAMTAAARAGVIESTGRTTYPEGERRRTNHNQRLTVWRAIP